METRNRFIAPERMGAWLVVTLGTAVAAFVIAAWGVYESRTISTVQQVELLKFDERIKALEQSPKAALPAPTAAMPAESK